MTRFMTNKKTGNRFAVRKKKTINKEGTITTGGKHRITVILSHKVMTGVRNKQIGIMRKKNKNISFSRVVNDMLESKI